MDAECQPDGNWQPDPAGVVCTAAMTSNGKLMLSCINKPGMYACLDHFVQMYTE